MPAPKQGARLGSGPDHQKLLLAGICASLLAQIRIGVRHAPRLCEAGNTYIAKQLSGRLPMQADPTLLRNWIDRAARRDPEKPWIVLAEGGRVVTYGELWQGIGRVAAFLHQRGLSANDRVALLATNSIEHLVCYFGVMAYGATICTVHVEMNRNQLGNIFTRLKPALVLYQDGLELDDLLASVTAPRMRLGRWDNPDEDTFYGALTHLAIQITIDADIAPFDDPGAARIRPGPTGS